jgi:hypothetical protein
MDHLLYYPDLASADFGLFQKLTIMLKGKRFFDIEDTKSSVKGILTDIPVQYSKKLHWVLGLSSPGVKQQGCEADHSPPTSGKVKKTWTYTCSPLCIFIAWCLIS